MNVLFLNSVPTHVFGGIEFWTGMVAHGLLERGHQVTIVGRPDSEYVRRNRDIHARLLVHELDISGDFNPVTIAAIKRIIHARQIEVVIANFNKDIRLGGLAAAFEGNVKVIWRAGLNQTKDNFVHRTLTPRLLDGVITPSHHLKAQIVGSGYIPEEIVKPIHTGIPDLENPPTRDQARGQLREKYLLPEDSVIGVTSGRFVDQKGHAHLVAAMPGIVERNPKIRFLWLGNGPLETSLKQQLSESNMLDRVTFAGLLEDFTLELLGADLMIHPSIEEPFGIVLLEGMRASLPIVASRVGGIPEVVAENETAVLVPPADPATLTDAVNSLLDTPDRLRTMGEAGRRRWQVQFSYDAMLNTLEQHLQAVIGSKAGVK